MAGGEAGVRLVVRQQVIMVVRQEVRLVVRLVVRQVVRQEVRLAKELLFTLCMSSQSLSIPFDISDKVVL